MRRSGQATTLPPDGPNRSVVRARNEGQQRPGFEPDHFPVVAGDPAVGPPVRVGGRLYVATRSRRLALDAASGRPLWTSAKERIVNGPLATPASVVVATADGIPLGFAP
jgi:hypothetical protein